MNNSLYIGELVWNRQRFIKDPSTGRSVPHFNPEEQWIHQNVPEPRIIPQPLWNAAKARQHELDKRSGPLGTRKRPQYLLSGLLSCGECGGGYSKINGTRYGCSSARNKGASVCTNKKTILREQLESTVLNALQTHLMREDLIQVFCEEYARHMNTLRSAQNTTLVKQKAEAARLAKEKENIIRAIKDGLPATVIKDELARVAARQDELAELIANQSKEPRPLIHPTMARRYHQEVEALRNALTDGQAGEAAQHVRGLIEKIVLTSKEDEEELSIDLYGDLAGILRIATDDKSTKYKSRKEKRLASLIANNNYSSEPSVQLVAGEGFEPPTFGL